MGGWYQLGIVGLYGGLLALERRAILQAMFSRPLVASTGMGVLLGDPTTGLWIGVLLELFHLGGASLGASLPEHETLSATSTTAAAVLMAPGESASPALWSLSILLCGGSGSFGRWLERRLDADTARRAEQANTRAEHGALGKAMRENLWALWAPFWVFGGATVLFGGLGLLLRPVVTDLSGALMQGLTWAFPAMLTVAAACGVRGSRSREAGRWGTLGGLAALLWVVGWWLGGEGT
ncbi:MAG TPA: PTS sugar transporter subunit IIC [Myxococcaceae bacterium]|nr:PTS sugar transporter subunit IIC [Myxococcaceae bacterium]